MRNKKVVIIGTGIGGSVAGALFSSSNFDVTVVEKNRKTGGSCSYYEKDGFIVDIGTHLFTRGNNGPIGLAQVLSGVKRRIEFLQIPCLSEARGLGFHIVLPSQKWKLPFFFASLFRQLRLKPREIIDAVRLLKKMASISDEECEMWMDSSMEDFLLLHTNNPGLLGFFGFLLGLYFVLPLWKVSAGEALYCYRRMFEDMSLSYPRGGARKVPETFIERTKECGGKIIVGNGVKKIVVEDGKVRGVELNDGEFIPADFVISTTSPLNTLALAGEENFPEEYVDEVKKIRGSFIAVQAKIALKKKLLKCGCLVGGIARNKTFALDRISLEDFKKIYSKIEEGKLPEVIPVYAPVPSNFDPELAPPGTQLITACAVAPTTDIHLKDEKKKWIDSLLSALDELVPGLLKNALWVDTFDVEFIESWIGKKWGPAISNAQIVGQTGWQRLPHRTPVEGLYLAGDCAGGRGVGTELAARSSIDCFYEIKRELKFQLSRKRNYWKEEMMI